jgi:hypothetical protein
MKVKINIDTIILNNISKQETAGFVQELQLELSRLIRERGAYSNPNTDALEVRTYRLTGETKHRSAGERTAHSIYSSLMKR